MKKLILSSPFYSLDCKEKFFRTYYKPFLAQTAWTLWQSIFPLKKSRTNICKNVVQSQNSHGQVNLVIIANYAFIFNAGASLYDGKLLFAHATKDDKYIANQYKSHWPSGNLLRCLFLNSQELQCQVNGKQCKNILLLMNKSKMSTVPEANKCCYNLMLHIQIANAIYVYSTFSPIILSTSAWLYRRLCMMTVHGSVVTYIIL